MKIAIAQLAPVLLERDATLAKAAAAVREAGAAGARLVCFGETFAPAYPVWLSRTDGARFDDADQKRLHALYLDQAVRFGRNPAREPGDLADLCAVASKTGASVVIGVAERAADRGGHSLYCSRVFIAGDGPQAGEIVSVHRKLMPTYEERLCWGVGDGAGLVTHAVGPFTVGGLNCWENWIPTARAALYAAGENLHVALWPGCARLTRDITRFIALESRSYVISAGALIRAADIPQDVPLRERIVRDEAETLYDGGSCVAGPDGSWLIEPVTEREALLYADLDPARVLEERQNFDPAGHYARPDVLRLTVDRRRQSAAEFLD